MSKTKILCINKPSIKSERRYCSGVKWNEMIEESMMFGYSLVMIGYLVVMYIKYYFTKNIILLSRLA
jgi:hypothetical protein